MINFPGVFKTEQPKAAPAAAVVDLSPVASAIRTPSPAVSVNQAVSNTWSAKAAANGKEVIDVSPSKLKPLRVIFLNAEKYRIDERLPLVPPAVYESLKKKRENYGNLCNDYYLKGKCPSESYCNYVCSLILIVPAY
jgi:hypothetical protein